MRRCAILVLALVLALTGCAGQASLHDVLTTAASATTSAADTTQLVAHGRAGRANASAAYRSVLGQLTTAEQAAAVKGADAARRTAALAAIRDAEDAVTGAADALATGQGLAAAESALRAAAHRLRTLAAD